MQQSKLYELKLWRATLCAVAIVFIAVSAVGKPALAKSGLTARPTIVLVHGAWAGPSGWSEVVAGLNRDGYNTTTPTLALLSIDGDVATVRAALDGIPGQKILVAHSYGGIVISNAAFGRSDVLELVYTTAFVPDSGDTILSLGNGFIPSGAFNHLVFTGTPGASPALIDPAFFPQFFAQDLNPKLAADLNAAQRPINPQILGTPSGPGAWHTLPSWYAVSGADLIIDPAEQRWMAQRAGAMIIQFDDASHAGGYTHYATRFVKLIEEAVQSVSGSS
jgi:pimeloyl-ACP methyl ester carboxylesterase